MHPDNQKPENQTPLTPSPAPLGQFGSADTSTPQATLNPQPEYNVDYLNSIAPRPQKKLSNGAVFGMIGGLLLAVTVAFIAISAPKGPTLDILLPQVEGRIATLKSVTDDQSKRLSSNDMTTINATLNSTLYTMDADISGIVKDQKLGKNATKDQQSAEKSYATKLTKTLDDAYQRGTLDRTYDTQMIYELTILGNQINKVRSLTKNQTTRDFCDNAIKNINLTLEALDKFDGSKT